MNSRDQLRSNVIATATTTAGVSTSTISVSDTIKRRIENTTEGLSSECYRLLHNRVLAANKENAMLICDYITSLRSEVNPSEGHRENILILAL